MNSPRLRALIALSIAAALISLGMKSAAYLVSGSIGLLSDALESCVNLVAALTAWFSLWYAARPVDATHTYGHQKIEYFSSGLEGVLIIGAGIAIIVTAVQRFYIQVPLESIGLGAAIALAGTLVNVIVARILLKAGTKYNSIVLEADGQHLMADVFTSIGVVVGLLVVWVTNAVWLDPVIAIGVALYIVVMGFGLVRRSFNGLMDHALPEKEQEQFRAAVKSELPEGMQFHALRTRQAGARRFVDFHLLVPGSMTVRDAHDVAGRVEEALRRLFPAVETTIHIEPIEAIESWSDNALAGIEPSSLGEEAARKLEVHELK